VRAVVLESLVKSADTSFASPTRLYSCWVSLFFLFLVGCDIPERPRQVTISHPAVFRPANPDEITSIEQALGAVITVCRDDLHLPVVEPLQVFLYKNKASLAFYGHGWRTLPVDIPNELAFARSDTMHINLQGMGEKPWGTIVGILAHEYGHTVQNQVAGLSQTYPFVDEGFGEWVSAKVTDSLKWQDYSIALHRSQREILRQREALPDIDTLKDPRVWRRLSNQRNGHARTYVFAFLILDGLIQRKGLPAVLEYMRQGNRDEFIGSVTEYMAALGKTPADTTSSKDSFSINAPEWKVGYRWRFKRISLGKSSTEFREIIGEETYRGRPVFVIKSSPDEESLYGKDSVWLALRKNGKIISEPVSTQFFLPWPLEPGKESKDFVGQRDFVEKQTTKFERSRIVVGLERIHVPAGYFRAVKIESFEGWSGLMLGEYWYAPEVKWIVKRRLYTSAGVTEDELVRAELKEARNAVN